MRSIPALLLGLVAVPAMAASPFRITDMSVAGPVEYLIISADVFADQCDALLELRQSQGHSVGLVAYSDLLRSVPGVDGTTAIYQFLAAARQNWRTRWCLLVGDGGPDASISLPMVQRRSDYYSDKFLSEPVLVTDYDYGAGMDLASTIHMGRFPVHTTEQLATAIAKTLRYETDAAAGMWQSRLAFAMGQSGFNALVDGAIESLFSQLVVTEIPPQYGLELAYAKASSEYAPYPPRFDQNAVRLLSQGGLMFVYVGHGHLSGADTIQWQGREYPILEAADFSRVSATEGLPVMVAIACSTAQLDSPRGDSLAEAALAQPGGPVAFIGSTRVCQPYGNALLGRGLVTAVLGEDHETLGEALDRARELIMAPDDSPARRKVDALAGMIQGGGSLQLIRQDTVRHYILVGDPALRLRRPQTLAVEAAQAGQSVTVTATAPFAEGTARVLLECPRDAFTRDLPRLPRESAPEYGDRMDERYRLANDKVWGQAEVPVRDGVISATIAIPAELRNGKHRVRVVAWTGLQGAAGAAEVTVKR